MIAYPLLGNSKSIFPTTNLPLRLLLDDPNPEVVGLATDILNDRAIQYYELEAL